jgi:hypothetical protein
MPFAYLSNDMWEKGQGKKYYKHSMVQMEMEMVGYLCKHIKHQYEV